MCVGGGEVFEGVGGSMISESKTIFVGHFD